MKLQTKYFGEIEYEESEILTFPVGLFGFEEEHQFLLLPFEGSAATLLCLQSVATPALAFVAMDPFSQELGFYVLCVVKKPVSESTVNLKCPVAVHPETRVAQQVILETDRYEMRHLLSQFGPREGAPC